MLLGLELLFAVSAVSQTGCGLCHIPARAQDDLSHSTHKGTACSTCHQGPGVAGAVRYNLQAADHFVTWLTRRPASSGGDANLVASACPRCHQHARRPGGHRRRGQDESQAGDGVRGGRHRQHRPSLHRVPRAGGPQGDPGGVASLDPHTTCSRMPRRVDRFQGVLDLPRGRRSGAVGERHDDGLDPHPAGWAAGHGMGDESTCSLCHPSSYCEGCHKINLPHDPVNYIYTHGKEAMCGQRAVLLVSHSRPPAMTATSSPCLTSAELPPATWGRTPRSAGRTSVWAATLANGCDTCHVKHIHPGVPQSVQDKLKAQSAATRSSRFDYVDDEHQRPEDSRAHGPVDTVATARSIRCKTPRRTPAAPWS